MKKRSKKKLPKYWLGTRMPTSTGRLIGNVSTASYSSTPGENIMPEVRAIRSNTIPGAINKLQLSASPALNLLRGASSATTAAGSLGAARSVSDISNVLKNVSNVGVKTGGSSTGAGSSAASGALGTTGAILGGIGTLYGLTDMGFQIANLGSHRSAGEMSKTLTTDTITTDKGTTYTQKSGINAGAEMAYDAANRRAKQFNFGATSIGTGMAAGATIGALAGSSVPLLGTAIGAGVGALVGGAGILLGLGDTEEDTRRELAILGDSTFMDNRQSKGLAENQDVRKGYYNSLGTGYGTGIVGAALGKKPVYGRGGKTNAKVSKGELIGNLEEGWMLQVPGKPNNKDTENANIKKPDYVVSNLFVPYTLATGDVEGALIMLDMYNKNKIAYKNAPGYIKAKCGKMPKYALGTVGEYVAALLPHAVQLAAAGQQYSRDYNASTYVPKMEADYSGAINSAYRMMGDLIDKRPYLNQSNDAFRQAAWNLRRNPGYGYGGRMIGYDSLFRSKLAQDAQTSLNIDLQNLTQRNKAETALLTLLSHSTDINNQNMGAWIAMTQLANAAKENALRQDLYNLTVPIAGAASDYLKVADTNAAREYKERIANMYNRLITLDELRTLRDWLDRDSENTKNDVSSVYNLYKLSTPDLLSLYRSYANRLADKMGTQFTLTPPTQFYIDPRYGYRNIPMFTYKLR